MKYDSDLSRVSTMKILPKLDPIFVSKRNETIMDSTVQDLRGFIDPCSKLINYYCSETNKFGNTERSSQFQTHSVRNILSNQ